MAEGWARYLKPEIFKPYSAGLEVKNLDQSAVKVMRESGVDISRQRSKHINELRGIDFDYVVTVCGHADENCPFFPAKTKVIHVGFEDPPKLAERFDNYEDKMNCYRKVRDEIRDFVKNLPSSFI
jgi:arsenate reductase